MKEILSIFSITIISCILVLSCKKTPQKELAHAAPKNQIFEPNWESIKANYKDPKWFNEQKFGIFVHWGAYTVPAFGSEWYPRQMYMDTANFGAQLQHLGNGPTPEYGHHKEKWGNQKEFGHKDFIPLFKGEKFNAAEWISLFKKAGAIYVIPVADHHDGFAMYNSNTTRWNAANMGPKRDVLGELFKEGRDQGLIMGASSHFAFNWSFYPKKNHFDTMNPEFADLYSSKGSNLEEPVSGAFKQHWWNRITDLIDNYRPEVLWLDFYVDIPDFKEYRPQLAAYYYNKGLDWGKEVVINDKNLFHEAFPEGTVIYDLERGKMSDIRKLPWQTDTSIGKNSWSHVSNWESKTANSLIDDLADIVSKNGNLLLNVGPKSDGTIPQDQQDILMEIGNWLKVNGEAIYGTSYWNTFGEGPTVVSAGYMSELNGDKKFTHEDIRFTQKKGTIYAIILDWPENGAVNIKSLGSNSEHADGISIQSVQLLGSTEEMKFDQTEDGLLVSGFGEKQGDYAHILKLIN